jgi:hypothetical protein
MAPQNESLLADLALRMMKSAEDVATEGRAYVLQRSDAARAWLQRTVSEWLPGMPRRIESFRTQATAEDKSRPDLEAHDADGVPVILFENKFWAGLTDNQPVAYLKMLESGGGALCFVAPTVRVPLLWTEVVNRAKKEYPGLQMGTNEEHLKLARHGENLLLAMTSWDYLLRRVLEAVDMAGDSAMAGDIRQLQGLAARMDTAGFIPLTAEDITGSTARLVLQVCDLINLTMEELLQRSFASKQGLRAAAGQGWYGHYFWLQGHACQLAFKASMWAEHGGSPVWLRVLSPSWKYTVETDQAMNHHLGKEACFAVRAGSDRGTWTPIHLPEGRERDDVVAAMVRQIEKVAKAVSGLTPVSGPQVPPPGEVDAE